MNRFTCLFAAPLLALAAAGCATVADSAPAASTRSLYAAAVADPKRPQVHTMLDESRKPVEVLEFLGVKPGMDVADLVSESGYWAYLLNDIVGPEGTVAAWQPNDFFDDDKGKALWANNLANSPRVSLLRYPFDKFAPPALSLDAAIINISYHDKYWESEKYKVPRTDPRAYVRALYGAMRPGAQVVVIDHTAKAGSDTRSVVDKLHRIDPAVVRADWEAAGFRLVAESDLLRNPADDLTKDVFDPAVRYKTDRFMMKFVKPR